MRFRLLAVGLLLCSSALLLAQQDSTLTVPRFVRFSGTVLKGESSPGRTVGVTFSLYKEQSGGAPLWQEVQNVTLRPGGHYSVLLGVNSKAGVPTELFTTNEARWLGVQVEQEAEQPRVLLVSVPYALKAGDAETLGGKPLSAFLLAAPTATTANAITSSTSTAAPTSSLTTSAPIGSGSQYYLARWVDNSGTLGNSTIFDNGSAFIGIGQNSPGSMLDVNGLLHIGAHAQQTTGYEQFILGQNSSVIGTTDGNSVLFRITHDVPSGSPSTGLLFQFRQNDNSGAALWGYSMKQVKNAGEDSTYLAFHTNSTIGGATERMRIDKNGSVGIGTTTPAATLDVNGSIRFRSGGITFPDATVQSTASNVTGVSAGSGLSGGGSSGNVSLSANFSAVQARVTGTCASGTAVGSIGADGSVACNLVSGGGGGSLTLPFSGSGLDSPPSVQGLFKVTDSAAGPANSNTGPPDPNSVPAAILGVASGTGITAGVIGKATSSQGVGVVAINTAAAADPLDGTPVMVSWSQATSGKVTLFEGMASSPLARGMDLQFAVTPQRNIIQAEVGVEPNAVQVFTVDGSGNMHINGNLSKGSGSFKIDHPLDPADKYLYHSFVESPDMMNIYNGVVVLDSRGQAWIQMPDWFEALNMDFRYQLTAMGRPAPNLYIARGIKGNCFKIAGGRAHGKVSWQVTGVRHDAYANAHRIPVEQEKVGAERGKYLHPELFGHPQDDSAASATPVPSETASRGGSQP